MVCPECGCDWNTLEEKCKSSEKEDRIDAEIITGNCPECKKSMEEKHDN